MTLKTTFLFVFLTTIIISENAGKCPKELSVEFQNICYAIKFDLLRKDQAQTSCESLAEGAELAIIHDPKLFDKFIDRILKFIKSKTKKGYYWVGLRAEPPPRPGEKRETDKRRWIFDIDDSLVIEEEYELWSFTPSDKLSCAVINGSDDFSTTAVDCGGPRVPLICQKPDSPCYDANKPYLLYGDMCLAVINGALEYNKIHGACNQEGKPASIKNLEEKKHIVRAGKNGFMGGTLMTGLQKQEDGTWAYRDGHQPGEDEWEEDEPKDKYDCAGLSLQLDNTVKYRTSKCGELSSFLCSLSPQDGEDD